jgi:predicted Zn finger-like uncharacterized protein
LIVTCEQCATQFQLADAKVPVGGARVRCSRCKHAFFIEPPAREQAQDPVEHAAQAVLDSEAPPEPEATEDLADSEGAGADFAHPRGLRDENDLGSGDENDLSAGDESDLSGDADLTDESDWEFNEAPFGDDTPATDAGVAAQDAAREAIDDLLGSRPAATASKSRSQPVAFAPSADAEEEELGSPESWDLLAGDAPSSPTQASGAVSPDNTALAGAPSIPEPMRAASVARPAVEAWVDPSEPSRLLAWIARSGHAAGWSVTAGLFGLVAVATLGPGLSKESESALGTQHLAQLEAQAIAGRWVENAAAGSLFVVSGRLVNPTAAPLPLGTLAGVRLLDESGARLASEMAAIGPVMEPLDLREADPTVLQARQLEGGRSLATTALEPGQSIAFEAVVLSVPAAASRFVLEPIAAGRGPAGRGAPLAAASEPAPAR